MEVRRFGRSELDVPCVGLGSWRTLDAHTEGERSEAIAVVSEAVSAGCNLFDSSPMYGNSEEVLGVALRPQRQEAIVATKVWTQDDEESERQIARSLSFFGGLIDIYQVHNLVAWKTRLAQLERLHGDGRVRVVGATHHRAEAFGELASLMRSGRIDAIQIPYNPIEREAEQLILPLAQDLDIGVVVMRPFAAGELLVEPPRAAQLAPLSKYGISTWPQALLKWVLSDARCHVAIPATSRRAVVGENAFAGQAPWLDGEGRALVESLALAMVHQA